MQMSMRITLARAYCQSRVTGTSAHSRAIRINCGWVHGETHATIRTGWAIAREWSTGDYRGIITLPAPCTCDLCLICN
ncbi:hypothetical protein PUN28_018918 [Cardiocondyla obscurior]|uniref:Uncharacterized protein n=1 Tax=Cardiocondyla obscurior TaxID=286306 RepID=A0AAW2EDY6_9HYME